MELGAHPRLGPPQTSTDSKEVRLQALSSQKTDEPRQRARRTDGARQCGRERGGGTKRQCHLGDPGEVGGSRKITHGFGPGQGLGPGFFLGPIPWLPYPSDLQGHHGARGNIFCTGERGKMSAGSCARSPASVRNNGPRGMPWWDSSELPLKRPIGSRPFGPWVAPCEDRFALFGEFEEDAVLVWVRPGGLAALVEEHVVLPCEVWARAFLRHF